MGDRGRLQSTAGNNPGDMRAVAIRINPAHRRVAQNPSRQVGMVCIHTKISDANQDIAAGQLQIIDRGDRVGGRGHLAPAQVIGRNAGVRELHLLHARQARQRGQEAGCPGRRISAPAPHPKHRPKRRRSIANGLHSEIPQLVEHLRRAIGKERQVKRLRLRQSLPLKRQGQQRRLEFEVRLVRQDGLDLGIGLQPLRNGCRRANQVRLVGNVGNHGGPGGPQARAKSIVQRRARLDNIGAGIAGRAQMIGNGQRERLGSIEQGIFKQQSRRTANKLAEWRGRIFQAQR